MQAWSPGYEQLALFFTNTVNMDLKDSNEGTSELTMETDFHLKKAETGAEKLLLWWQKEQQICCLHTVPHGTGVAQKTTKI